MGTPDWGPVTGRTKKKRGAPTRKKLRKVREQSEAVAGQRSARRSLQAKVAADPTAAVEKASREAGHTDIAIEMARARAGESRHGRR